MSDLLNSIEGRKLNLGRAQVNKNLCMIKGT